MIRAEPPINLTAIAANEQMGADITERVDIAVPGGAITENTRARDFFENFAGGRPELDIALL
jgi:hypothetical protein